METINSKYNLTCLANEWYGTKSLRVLTDSGTTIDRAAKTRVFKYQWIRYSTAWNSFPQSVIPKTYCTGILYFTKMPFLIVRYKIFPYGNTVPFRINYVDEFLFLHNRKCVLR